MDGLINAGFEGYPIHPAQFAAQLAAVDVGGEAHHARQRVFDRTPVGKRRREVRRAQPAPVYDSILAAVRMPFSPGSVMSSTTTSTLCAFITASAAE